MAQDITIQGADYSAVPAVRLPKTPTTLIPSATANISKTLGSGTYYADGIVGVADYSHEAVTATIDGVKYVFPRDPDPNNYADGYIGYGANYTSASTMSFSTYQYRVEDDDSQGKWRLYAPQAGEHTISVITRDTAPFHDVSVTTANANTVQEGRVFLDADGVITTGTMSGGASVKQFAIRPDAELVQTFTYDKLAVEDEELTIPSYTTTATTLKSSTSLTPTVTLDMTNYNYIVVTRCLTIPTYSIVTKAKGRVEYSISDYIYEIGNIPANTFTALVDGTTYTSATTTVTSSSFVRLVYFTSATAITAYSTASYGVYQTPSTPTISSSVLTLKSPAFSIRGHATYFTSTYMNALDDIRFQYVHQVWRAPKNNLNYDGWEHYQGVLHIADCAASSTHKLT